MEFLKIYLSGSFSDWRKRFKAFFQDEMVIFYEPYLNEDYIKLSSEEKDRYIERGEHIGAWLRDIFFLGRSDFVVVYLEKGMENKCYGTVFELGYALAKGKQVILVNELSHRHFKQFEGLAVTCDSLEKAAQEIKSYLKMVKW